MHCTYDPATRGGDAPDGRKIKSTIHWVSAAHAVKAEIRLYDRLFTKEILDEVGEGEDYSTCVNPKSLEVLTGCCLEPGLAEANPGEKFDLSIWIACASSPRPAAVCA